MVAAIAALIILCMHLPSGNAKLESRSCQPKWNLLSEFTYSSNPVEFIYEFNYRVGMLSSQSSNKPYETIASVAVKIPSSGNQSSTELKQSNNELTQSTVKTGKIVVGAQKPMKIWQLIVESENQVFGFDYIVSNLEPPAEVSSCLATYNVREWIQRDSRVRLRHQSTGMYMVVTDRKGWNAATLGYSQSYYFRFTSIGNSYTRITTDTYSYPGYRYLYSSTFGGIYFDQFDGSSDKQEWILSNPNPRDGDAVTFLSQSWPGAYIVYLSGYTPSVYCEYTSSPDKWIIELVQ